MALLLCSCGTYDNMQPGGKFEGEARMVPITPNTFFFYRPQDRSDVLFAYTLAPDGKYASRFKDGKITPDAMLTTGASVPRILWRYRGLSPFDYTRAALIHDWLFEAHHRYDYGEYLFKNGTDDAAMRKGERLTREYADYKDLTQDDAANIYGECIRALMDESAKVQEDLYKVIMADPEKLTVSRLKELAESLDGSKKSRFHIWAHHWATSTRCLVPTAKEMWKAQHDDLGVYEVIAESEYAVKQGYMSPWLRKKFQAIYREPKTRADKDIGKLAGVSQAVNQAMSALREQDKAGTLRARIYLEVPDAATQTILLSRASAFAGMDMKPDRNIQTDIGRNDLVVYYYRSEDGKEAREVLQTVLEMLPADRRPTDAMAKFVESDGLFRPKHYDLHIGSSVASAIGG